MTDNFSVNSFNRGYLEEIFGATSAPLSRIDYFNEYFNGLKSENNYDEITIIKENKYIDKFYLRDYSRYYSEAFEQFHNRSERIHFFSGSITKKEFREILKKGKSEKLLRTGEDKERKYLGHITVKPVKDEYNSKLIGRTAVATYPKKEGQNSRIYLKANNHCSLFGIDLFIDAVPFKEQDPAVGACASACLWVSQFVMNNWYSIPIRSLAEITELSRLQTPYAYPTPLYPSAGLTPAEITTYVEKLSLHFHIIGVEKIFKYAQRETNGNVNLEIVDELIEDIIKAYINAGFPIICALKLSNQNDDGGEGHAVLLSGYKTNRDDKIIELYLHDDQIGPYCRTEFNGCKISWKNNWNDFCNIDNILLTKFIIPVDPLVKLNFLQFLAPYYLNWKVNSYKAELKLYHISNYKKLIFSKKFKRKTKILSKNMPRYVWVVHLYENDTKNISRDAIFDANTVILRSPIEIVEFT